MEKDKLSTYTIIADIYYIFITEPKYKKVMNIKSLMSFEGSLSYMVTSVLIFIVLVTVDSGLHQQLP